MKANRFYPSKLLRFGVIVFVTSLSTSVLANNLPWPGMTLQGQACTGQVGGYGPYDYTNPQHLAGKLSIVEQYHFDKNVESLIKGVSGSLDGDLDYTLRAFPNHHRALYSMMRYQMRAKKQFDTPIECYFQRALYFQPRDMKVYQLYGYYLQKKKQDDMALQVYAKAAAVNPEVGRLYFAMGQIYFKQKRYEEAVKQAKLAEKNGYNPAKLKKKLMAAGQWNDKPLAKEEKPLAVEEEPLAVEDTPS